MKTAPLRKLICGFALMGLAVTASAQDLFTYSGGNGTPLSLSLNRDIQFTLQGNVTAQYGIGFSIINAFSSPQVPGGNLINILSGLSLSDSQGSIPTTIANIGVPNVPPAPDNTANLDSTTLYLFFQFPASGGPPGSVNLLAGDVITLTMGTAITADNFSLPTPVLPSAADVVVHDGMANQLATVIESTPAPEPSMLALSALGGVAGLLCFRRRK